MKIPVIIQARMNSQRFPGKVLKELQGRPLLDHLVERLKPSERIERIIVATSMDMSDQPIAQYCLARGIPCFRGTLENVAQRFKGVIEEFKLRNFVRLCADSPLLDCHFLDEGIKTFVSGRFDIVTNVLKRSFPKGQSFEIFTSPIFLENYEKIRTKEDCEHATAFFYKHAEQFRIFNMECPYKGCKSFNFSIDTQEDFQRINRILGDLKKSSLEPNLEHILKVYPKIAHEEIAKA